VVEPRRWTIWNVRDLGMVNLRRSFVTGPLAGDWESDGVEVMPVPDDDAVERVAQALLNADCRANDMPEISLGQAVGAGHYLAMAEVALAALGDR
jgi:hypothetical protein